MSYRERFKSSTLDLQICGKVLKYFTVLQDVTCMTILLTSLTPGLRLALYSTHHIDVVTHKNPAVKGELYHP